MKYLFIIAALSLTFLSCQPNFSDPELEDRIELLENRVKQLEEQLRILKTNLSASSPYRRGPEEDNTFPVNTDVNTTTEPPAIPRKKSNVYSESRNNSSRTNSSPWRCQATTRKGTQCKRSARSGGYCWQHGG